MKHGQVFDGLTIEDLKTLLIRWGYQSEIYDIDASKQAIQSVIAGWLVDVWPFQINLQSGDATPAKYSILTLILFTNGYKFTLEAANQWNDDNSWACAYVDKYGDARLQMDIVLSGATEENLAHYLGLWEVKLLRFREALKD